MTHAIVVEETGGPSVMKWREVTVPKPKRGEALIRATALGVNFIDIYERTGLYNTPTPFIPGREGVGVVEAVGAGVTAVKPGDRVAYCAAGPGAYAEARVMDADKLVKLPKDVPDELAAAIIFKGLTAWFLVRRTHKVAKGDVLLIHAAAGGVGQILTQWAKHLGATVIATAGGAAKCRLVKRLGADHCIDYRAKDFVKEVKRLTKGQGVDVVLRFGRQGDLPRLARLPAPARALGQLRQRLRARAALRAAAPGAEGLAVHDPADALRPYPHARGAERRGARAVGLPALGRPHRRGGAELRAEGRRQGAPRPRRAQDHWADPADPVILPFAPHAHRLCAWA